MAEDQARLLFVEGNVVLVGDRLAGVRVVVEEAFDDLALEHRPLDYLAGVLRCHLLVENSLGSDHQQRAALAKAVAAGSLKAHLTRQAPALYLRLESLTEALAAQGAAPGVANRQGEALAAGLASEPVLERKKVGDGG